MDKRQPEQLSGIRAALANAGTGSALVTLGIVDGLPDLGHPALRGASIEILETMVPPDCGGPDAHGTAVCSIIFGRSNAVCGLAPGCLGLSLPIFFRKGTDPETRPVSQLDLARAISFGLERGVSIINISAGQKSATVEPDSHLEQALQAAIERRVLLIAAAGNDGCACIHLPATEFAYAIGPRHARRCPRLSIPVGRPELRLAAMRRKGPKLRGLMFPQSAEPRLHFLPGSAVGYLQKLLLATLLPAGPQERRALLVLRPCSF